MNRYIIKTIFKWDDMDDEKTIIVYVPYDVDLDKVRDILSKEHDYLDSNVDEEDIYTCNGRNIETLMDYVCEKYGWECREFLPDDVVIFI